MTTVLGIDACPAGWVGVELRDGRFGAAHRGSTLEAVIGDVAAAAIAVDIPLGLVEVGWRDADIAAKKFLRRRSSSVFIMPPRPALAEHTHALASARCRELTGNGLSVQAWGLKAKLLQANSLYESGSHALYEVHPEVSFTAMGLTFDDGGKRSWRGQRARLRRLHDVGIDLPDDVGAAGDVPTDDLLDAAAAAWSAHRIATGAASSLPDPPQVNERGRVVAIWY